MACFIIHWCAPDPNNEKYTQTIVDYVKGGKPMDEFVGFKMLTPQIHPHLGVGVLLEEADNLATVQEHTYPWTKGLGVTATITPDLSDEEYVDPEESMACWIVTAATSSDAVNSLIWNWSTIRSRTTGFATTGP